MTNRTIDLAEARALAEKAVSVKGGDYIYDEDAEDGECSYIIDGRPSCIVGHILVDLGYSPEQIHEFEGHSAVSAIDALEENSSLPIEFSIDAKSYLERVQDRQDMKVPWGEAIQNRPYF
jgi:hypothetical protein